jgi:hypothetical protein
MKKNMQPTKKFINKKLYTKFKTIVYVNQFQMLSFSCQLFLIFQCKPIHSTNNKKQKKCLLYSDKLEQVVILDTLSLYVIFSQYKLYLMGSTHTSRTTFSLSYQFFVWKLFCFYALYSDSHIIYHLFLFKDIIVRTWEK